MLGRRAGAALVLAVALIGPGCSAGAPPAAPPPGPTAGPGADRPSGALAAAYRVEMPYGGRGVAGLAHYLAVEDGFYARHGVEVSSPAVSAHLVATLTSGQAAMGATSMEEALHATAAGAPLVMVAAQFTGFASSVIARPAIQTPGELREQRLGVNAFASPTHTAALRYLRGVGLVPDDVTILPLGGVPEVAAALRNGAVDAVVIPPPLSHTLVHEGYREMADLATLDVKYHQAVLFTTRGWLHDHPEIARRLLAAYAEAQRAVLADPAAARRVLAKWVGVTDPVALEKTYALALRGIAPGPVVDREAVQVLIDLLAERQPQVGALRAADVVDNSLANEVAPRYGFPMR